jgi:hypothetical protein
MCPYRISAGLARGDGAMRLCLVVMLLVEAIAFPVKAADIAVSSATPAPSDWIITVGADARAVPLYMGSSQWGAIPVPNLGWRRPGSPEAFHSARDGIRIALFDNGVIALGPGAHWSFRGGRVTARRSTGLVTLASPIK